MKKSLTFWNIFPVLLIISGALLLIFRVMIRRKKQGQTTTDQPETIDEEAEIVEDEEEPLNREQSIQNHYAIIRKNLPDNFSTDVAKMVTGQAMHESGLFKSRLYREQNNLFGMRHPVARETLSIENREGFATYASLDDSVKDYVLYLKEFKLNPKSWDKVHTFVKQLKNSGYFTDEFLPYFNAVRTHYNTVKNLVQ